jgi:hypothetical protein
VMPWRRLMERISGCFANEQAFDLVLSAAEIVNNRLEKSRAHILLAIHKAQALVATELPGIHDLLASMLKNIDFTTFSSDLQEDRKVVAADIQALIITISTVCRVVGDASTLLCNAQTDFLSDDDLDALGKNIAAVAPPHTLDSHRNSYK